MASQSERREATRAALIAAARQCFLRQGFEATSTDAVLTAAGLSKGALYHHFQSKTDLMAAVFENVVRETAATAQQAAARPRSARKALGLALKAWVRAALSPEPRYFLLEAGPSVLGFNRARLIEETITQAPVRRSIERIVESGEGRCEDADLAARLLNAMASELALTAVRRGLDASGLGALDSCMDALIEALVPA